MNVRKKPSRKSSKPPLHDKSPRRVYTRLLLLCARARVPIDKSVETGGGVGKMRAGKSGANSIGHERASRGIKWTAARGFEKARVYTCERGPLPRCLGG